MRCIGGLWWWNTLVAAHTRRRRSRNCDRVCRKGAIRWRHRHREPWQQRAAQKGNQMKIDPRLSFWFGVLTTVMTAVAGGAIHLTNMVPNGWIPVITAWAPFFATLNSAVLTGLHAYSSSQGGLLASAPSVSEARQ